MRHRLTFTKKERLCSKKLTEKLFKKSHSFFEYPFKVVYFFTDSSEFTTSDAPAQVLFTASKRNLKKAVARNRTKRIMREAFRKNKTALYENLEKAAKKIVVGFIYNAPQTPEYQRTEQKIISIINRLIREVDQAGKQNTNPANINHQ
jgi:ribonuclease P protein component